MRAHLQRQGVPVARPAPIPCRHPLAAGTVERIMRHNGWRGVMRARRPPRTTEPDPAARRAPDLVGRRWRVAAPNLLEVADFTYVPLGTGGFGYTAFVVDAYAGLIPGWECSNGQRHRIRRAGVTPRGSLPVPTRLSVRPHNSSQRCRKSVHRNTLRRDADAGRTDRIDRHRRRRPGQRTVRNHDRALQDRVPAARLPVSHRADPDPRRPGEHDLCLGQLVQHHQADAPPGPDPTRRSRGLCFPVWSRA